MLGLKTIKQTASPESTAGEARLLFYAFQGFGHVDLRQLPAHDQVRQHRKDHRHRKAQCIAQRGNPDVVGHVVQVDHLQDKAVQHLSEQQPCRPAEKGEQQILIQYIR